jgi:hypothetical protein
MLQSVPVSCQLNWLATMTPQNRCVSVGYRVAGTGRIAVL